MAALSRVETLARVVALSLVWSVVGNFGCDRTPPGVPCRYDTDCARDERCVEGACTGSDRIRRPGGLTPPDSGVTIPDAEPRDAVAPTDTGVNPCPAVTISTGATFCTISAAVAAADEDTTIMIPAGRYAERVAITKRLALVGRSNGDRTIIEVTGATPAVAVTASGSELKHLTISAQDDVAIETVADLTLTVVTIERARGAGVDVRGAAVTLTNIAVGDVTPAMAGDLSDGAGVRANGGQLTFTDGVIGRCGGAGIFATDAVVRVTGTEVSGCGAGLVANRSDVALMSASFVQSGGPGVSLSGGTVSALSVRSSRNGRGGSGDGFELTSGTTGSVQGSIFLDNEGWGMVCATGARLTICADNTATGNRAGPVSCTGCN